MKSGPRTTTVQTTQWQEYISNHPSWLLLVHHLKAMHHRRSRCRLVSTVWRHCYTCLTFTHILSCFHWPPTFRSLIYLLPHYRSQYCLQTSRSMDADFICVHQHSNQQLGFMPRKNESLLLTQLQQLDPIWALHITLVPGNKYVQIRSSGILSLSKLVTNNLVHTTQVPTHPLHSCPPLHQSSVFPDSLTVLHPQHVFFTR